MALSYLLKPIRNYYLLFGTTGRKLFYGYILVVFLLIIFIRRSNPYSLSPADKDIAISTYSDQEVQGNSAISMKNNKGLVVEYRLQQGYQFPYCGITIRKVDGTFFNLAENSIDYLDLNIQVDNRQRLTLILNQYNAYTNSNALHLQTSIDCLPQKRDYRISLDQFVCPDWWLKQHQEQKNTPVDYNKFNVLSLQSDSTIDTDVPFRFELFDVSFSKSVKNLLYALLVCFVIISLLEAIIYVNRKKKKILIEYLPIAESKHAGDLPWVKIQRYVGLNYQKDIKLHDVFVETGLPKHQISSIIKQNTDLSFPQFLNTLRINEAERLLKATSMSVIQVGLEVGFQNITHFNRVFKQLKDQSPSEFRQKAVRE